MDTAATLFSGGGGADIGLSNANLDVRWGLEYDDDIASVARENGLHIHTGDVTDEDPADYESVDVLHASPPCPNFSVAKTGGEETDEDVSLARATVKFIRGTQPKLFTLENVWGYRKSQSWKLIREHLQRSGYDWNAWKLNAADYGVPQTRKRMIVAARKGGPRPKKPAPTHTENPSSGGLFGDEREKWVGWHEAIEDLIPALPDTELADWQKKRLPSELTESILHMAHANSNGHGKLPTQRPSWTIPADPAGGPPRAVLVSNAFDTPQNGKDRKPQTYEIEVASPPTTTQHEGRLCAVLIDGGTLPSASGNREDRKLMMYDGGDPANAVQASQHKGTGRAVLVGDNANTSSGARIHREQCESALTVRKSTGGHNMKAKMRRRVVQMTPRCLARFQTFPDWYDLPDSKSLACRIIGNAVPPLLMQRCIEAWT